MNINPCPNPECRKTCRVGHLDNQWHVWCGCGYDGVWKNSSAEAIRLDNLISPQPSAPVQPEQEPVAWLCKHGNRPHVYLPGEMTLAQSNDGLDIPLYASPSAQPQPEEAALEELPECPSCEDRCGGLEVRYYCPCCQCFVAKDSNRLIQNSESSVAASKQEKERE